MLKRMYVSVALSQRYYVSSFIDFPSLRGLEVSVPTRSLYINTVCTVLRNEQWKSLYWLFMLSPVTNGATQRYLQYLTATENATTGQLERQ